MTSPISPRHRALWARVEPRLPRSDLAHDAEHVLRVYGLALRLAEAEGEDLELVGAAALVHDLVAIPKDSAERPLGAERSAEASRGLLPEVGYTEAEVQAIVEAVRTCSWSRGLAPTSRLGALLQDADRLDAIGQIGAARCFATAQAMASRGHSGRLWHPEDPLGQDRALDDRAQALDHWARKLLHLACTMHSPLARELAARRHERLLRVRQELVEELEESRYPGPILA